MAEMILNNSNFEQSVISSDKPVVVDFWAPWCGPCQMMGPVLSELEKESEGKYLVGKVNVDTEKELTERFGIMSIPTLKVFIDGNVVASSVGYSSKNEIREMLGLV